MFNIGELPYSLCVSGIYYDIRTDFRDILNILCAFNDPDLENEEKIFVCLTILYTDFENIPKNYYPEAYKQAMSFIDNGNTEQKKGKQSPRIMDWEQDASLLFPAINKVAGLEVRSVRYMHWWTFLGYFMEIQEGVFSTILSMRSKKARGKALEKHEKEYWDANKDICVLRPKLTAEEQRKKEELKALLYQ